MATATTSTSSSSDKITAVSSGIQVHTSFPVARIKRIMQADEDVGKVALATPPAVSKSLEYFIISLVMKGAEEAKKQGTKKITATHLKKALLEDPQYDFLNDICETTADECAKKPRGKKGEPED